MHLFARESRLPVYLPENEPSNEVDIEDDVTPTAPVTDVPFDPETWGRTSEAEAGITAILARQRGDG